MFLDSFKPRIIHRGLDYFNNERVKKITFDDANIISGVVEGNEDYEVRIDIDDPGNSICSCPYGDLCKHMVALYFEAFPDMIDDCLYDDHDEDNDWYDDEDEDDYYRRSYFVVPTNYDELLDRYIENLSIEELKKTLKDILNKDRETTYNKFLKPLYESSKDRIQLRIDRINSRMVNIIDNSFSGRWDDYRIDLIEDDDKEFLRYEKDPRVNEYLKKIINDVNLYCFNDVLFLCEMARQRLSEEKIRILTGELRSFLTDLKNMGVKSLPKSNVLIALYELESRYDIDKLRDDFIRNIRYEEYTDYVIENHEDIDLLYDGLRNNADDRRIRKDLSCVFRKFYKRTGNKEAEELSHYYGFIGNNNLVDLDELVECEDFKEKYYPRILKEGNSYTRIQLYAKLNMKKELYEYLLFRKDYNKLCFFASFLDEYCHDELLKLFKEITLDKLKSANNRKEYAQAAVYVRAIKDLDDGADLVEEFIDELKADDRFRKRPALFDEIRQGLKR